MAEDHFFEQFGTLRGFSESIVSIFAPHDWLAEYLLLFKNLNDADFDQRPDIRLVVNTMFIILHRNGIDPYDEKWKDILPDIGHD